MTAAKTDGWKVGVEVWVRPRHPGRGYVATVTNIGRRWVTVKGAWGECRFDGETMALDGKGYTSPGRVWLSEAEYLEQTELFSRWQAWRIKLPYNPPSRAFSMADMAKLEALTKPEDGTVSAEVPE